MTTTASRHRTSRGELAYVDEGEGPATLLLHAFPQTSVAWRDLADLLSARFRVIVPDLLGAGDSVSSVGTAPGLVDQATAVGELLGHLGVDRFAAIGAGTGGGVAQLLALEGSVDALVLLNPIVEGYGDWPAPDGSPVVAELMRALTDTSPLAGRRDAFSLFEIPVLILWGEEDAYMPVQAAEELNEWIPSSTLGLLPGCGHYVLDDAIATIGPMIYEYLRARYLRVPHGHDPTGAVMIQLERRPEWVDLDRGEDDGEDGDDDEEDT